MAHQSRCGRRPVDNVIKIGNESVGASDFAYQKIKNIFLDAGFKKITAATICKALEHAPDFQWLMWRNIQLQFALAYWETVSISLSYYCVHRPVATVILQSRNHHLTSISMKRSKKYNQTKVCVPNFGCCTINAPLFRASNSSQYMIQALNELCPGWLASEVYETFKEGREKDYAAVLNLPNTMRLVKHMKIESDTKEDEWPTEKQFKYFLNCEETKIDIDVPYIPNLIELNKTIS